MDKGIKRDKGRIKEDKGDATLYCLNKFDVIKSNIVKGGSAKGIGNRVRSCLLLYNRE